MNTFPERPRINMEAVPIGQFFTGIAHRDITVERHDRISERYLTKADEAEGGEAKAVLQKGLDAVQAKREALERHFEELRAVLPPQMKSETPETLKELDVKKMDWLSGAVMKETFNNKASVDVLNRLGALSEGFGQLQLAEDALRERMISVEAPTPMVAPDITAATPAMEHVVPMVVDEKQAAA